MKRVVWIVAVTGILILLASCQPAPPPQQPQGASNEVQQPPAPPPASTPAPSAPAPSPSPAPAAPPTAPPPNQPASTQPTPPPAAPATAPATPGASANAPAAPTEPAEAKVKKALIGVVFTTNLAQGTFRVKVDEAVLLDHSFSGEKTRVARELKAEPGKRMVRFVVTDAKGVRGLREETMNLESGKHYTLRVVNTDTPGNIVVEHLE